MAVTLEKINTAVIEAERFIKCAENAEKKIKADRFAEYGCLETGSVRRASMDLTRALVAIRN